MGAGEDGFEATRETIIALAPNLPLDQIVALGAGQNSRVALVNGTWIFRLPKHDAAAEAMAREYAILWRLRGRLPVAIPEPIYPVDPASGEVLLGMGYPFLPGVPLRPADLSALPADDQRAIARQLLAFLRALHALPLAEVGGAALPAVAGYAESATMYEQVRVRLFPLMRPDARREVATRFESYLGTARAGLPERLVHGDFGPGNILYQTHPSAHLSGVVDWTSAGRGDPAVDLAALIGPVSFPLAVIAWGFAAYPEAEAMLDRAHFYASTFALQDALFGLAHDDVEAFESGIAEYR